MPNHIYETYKPEGFHTLSSYLIVDNPAELIDFLKNAFYALEMDRTLHPTTNEISNCILKIGDSCFMVSQAREPFLAMKTSFYLFVNDVDLMHQRALEFGATSVFEPQVMPYEDYQSGVMDTSGNYWWISKRLVEKGYVE